ncbi:MAG TPA: hypothetical protein V6C76_10500 [Drouetiella sp.]
MTLSKLPKFFAPSDKQPTRPIRQQASSKFEPVALLDNFFTGRSFGQHAEWILTTDQYGELQLRSAEYRNDLPSELRAQLAFNEVATGGRLRLLNVASLHVFRTQYINQPTNMAGLNDPMCLFGTIYEVTLYGKDSALLSGVEGTLTVSRSDLLNGILDGAEYVFHLGNRNEGSSDLPCFNCLLPADRVENVTRGHGGVLTYPLMPLDIEPGNTHNEAIILQLIYDVLSSLQKDLIEEGSDNFLTTKVIPVPSRIALEEDLRVNGFTINGDIAKRKRGADAKSQIPLLTALVDLFAAELVRLPPEAKPQELLNLAAQVISSIPGWPSNTSLATNKLCAPSNQAFREKHRHPR